MTVRDIKVGVENLPQGLEQLAKAYDDTVSRIERQGPGLTALARRVVCWITQARRPLYTTELQEALAVQAGDSELDRDNIVLSNELLTACAGLVTVDIESGIVRLIHYTTDEYFEHNRADWMAGALEYIASTCLTYLCFRELHLPVSGPMLPRDTFLRYATAY
jgi:hypothetical protein